MQLSKTDEDKLAALLDDPDFEILAEAESRFNIFDALGTRRQELRHSDFLSYLLDPSKPHGLSSRFLRDFMLGATRDFNPEGFFNSIEIRLLQFDEVKITREKFNIDVLIESGSDWCVLIENKIGAKEHGDQLRRYKAIAGAELALSKKLFLFLTPDGDMPSDENWIPISHELIAELCKKWSSDNSVPPRTREALVDYYEFLEAYVIDTSQTAELCRKIYSRHKDALDLIFRHIPNAKDVALTAAEKALQRLQAEGKIELDAKYYGLSRFWVPEIQNIYLIDGEKWTPSRRGILFEWNTSNNVFRLDIVIGPIDVDVKASLVVNLKKSDPEFYRYTRSLKFTHIGRTNICDIDAIDYQDGDGYQKMIEADIYGGVSELLETVVPNLKKCISKSMNPVAASGGLDRN